MERFAALPESTGHALAQLARDNVASYHLDQDEQQAQVADKKLRRANQIGDRGEPDDYTRPEARIVNAHNELAILLGEDYQLLLDTVEDLHRISKQFKWGFDLHAGNFMQRNDGTPVIVDPWVAD